LLFVAGVDFDGKMPDRPVSTFLRSGGIEGGMHKALAAPMMLAHGARGGSARQRAGEQQGHNDKPAPTLAAPAAGRLDAAGFRLGLVAHNRLLQDLLGFSCPRPDVGQLDCWRFSAM